MLQVGIRQFQGDRAWVVGQFGMQPDPTLGLEIRARQLLVKHSRGTRLACFGFGQRFAVTVLDRLGNDRGGAAQGNPRKSNDKQGAEADEQIAAGLGHAESGSWQAFAKAPASVRPGCESNPWVRESRFICTNGPSADNE
ncbi:hypothetical protein D3C76_1053660 [compost metagenome]